MESDHNQPGADPVEVLQALAAGDAERARQGGCELARQVLAAAPAPVRLALEVLAGGPFQNRRIVELCENLLDVGSAAKRGAA